VVLRARTPHGRRPLLGEEQERRFLAGATPVMVTEFGGISFVRDGEGGGSWGYSSAGSESEYADALRAQFEALRASSELVGVCYTQLMDTGLETNGLLFADGTPKLPIQTIREIVTGRKDAGSGPTSTMGWVGD
jgi:hypothetical protein